MIDKSTAP